MEMAAGSPATPHRMVEIQERLKAHGARYMVLERLPRDGLYRFHCQMNATERGAYVRGFEAVDGSPQQAMERVFVDVQRWLGRETDQAGGPAVDMTNTR